jgi:hypothetical protein
MSAKSKTPPGMFKSAPPPEMLRPATGFEPVMPAEPAKPKPPKEELMQMTVMFPESIRRALRRFAADNDVSISRFLTQLVVEAAPMTKYLRDVAITESRESATTESSKDVNT